MSQAATLGAIREFALDHLRPEARSRWRVSLAYLAGSSFRRRDTRRRRSFVHLAFLLWVFALWATTAGAASILLDVASAKFGKSREGRPSIMVTLSADSGEVLGRLTAENLDRDVVFRAEGKILMKARIRSSITNGRIEIVGAFGLDEAQDIARRLSLDGYNKIEVEVLAY